MVRKDQMAREQRRQGFRWRLRLHRSWRSLLGWAFSTCVLRSESGPDEYRSAIVLGSQAIRNVWSAASPQAKCEDVTSWSAQMYTAFVGVNHSWPGWNALRSFPH